MPGWTVTLDIHSATPRPDLDDLDDLADRVVTLVTLADKLLEHSPAVAIDPDGNGYSITLSIGAPDPATAVDDATRLVTTAAGSAELPDWPVVAVTAITHDEHDRQLAEPAYPPLAGVKELAAILEVSPQRITALRERADFPAPIAELAAGPVWVRDHITRFAATWERKPGRPRKIPIGTAVEHDTVPNHAIPRTPGDA